jgi:hypothetical protein
LKGIDMDPAFTLAVMRQAYITHDPETIRQCALDLLQWIRSGGFTPPVDEPQLAMLLWLSIGHNFDSAERIDFDPVFA